MMTLESISDSKKFRFFKRKIKKLLKDKILNPFNMEDVTFILMKTAVVKMHILLSYNPVGCEQESHKLERFFKITFPVFTKFKEISNNKTLVFKNKRYKEFLSELKDFFGIYESVGCYSTSLNFITEKKESLLKIINFLAQN